MVCFVQCAVAFRRHLVRLPQESGGKAFTVKHMKGKIIQLPMGNKEIQLIILTFLPCTNSLLTQESIGNLYIEEINHDLNQLPVMTPLNCGTWGLTFQWKAYKESFDPVNYTTEGNLKFKINNFQLRSYKVCAIECINIILQCINRYINII